MTSGSAIWRSKLGEARLDLLDERLDHRVPRLAAPCGRVRVRWARRAWSRRRGATIAFQAIARSCPDGAPRAPGTPHASASTRRRRAAKSPSRPSPDTFGARGSVARGFEGSAGCVLAAAVAATPCGRRGSVRRDRVSRAADERRGRQRAQLPGRARGRHALRAVPVVDASPATAGPSCSPPARSSPRPSAHPRFGAAARSASTRRATPVSQSPVSWIGDGVDARSRSRPSPTQPRPACARPRSTPTWPARSPTARTSRSRTAAARPRPA